MKIFPREQNLKLMEIYLRNLKKSYCSTFFSKLKFLKTNVDGEYDFLVLHINSNHQIAKLFQQESAKGEWNHPSRGQTFDDRIKL